MGASMWLNAGVAAGGLIALLLLWSGLRQLGKGQIWRGLRRGTGGLVLGALAAAVLLVGLNVLTYSRLTAETTVGTVRFVAQGPQRYVATFSQPRGATTTAELHGDEWQVSARFIKWKGLGEMLGLPPLYRLDRLSGRFSSIEEERMYFPTAAALSPDRGINLWHAAHRWSKWLPLVDASYGTATYLPMTDGAQYDVMASATGLLARPVNPAAREAVRNWE